MHFDLALRYLLSLGHETLSIKLGLRNTELLVAALGNPQTSFPSVQIAGTNGKGSTAVILDSICRAADIKTGLFTSPHLVTITERIKIAGQEISQSDFARLATAVRDVAQMLVNDRMIEALPTFFEHVTAIALLAFKEAKIDLAILEAGLGGRLDSTTVAHAQTVAITPIALDHQEYLGETLAAIAAEKAAIIHPSVVAIIAPQTAEALDVIVQRSKDCDVKPSINECSVNVVGVAQGRARVTFETTRDRYEAVLLSLRGRHQVTNASVAIRLAESLRDRGFKITREAIIQGMETANHPGRLELRDGPPRILLDGAHNPSGARALREYLDEFINGPITLIFGAMRDKNLEEMAGVLFPVANRLILTQPDNPRTATSDMLEAVASKNVPHAAITSQPSSADALRAAYEQTPADGVICVTGSLYLIGEIRAALNQIEKAGVAKELSSRVVSKVGA